MVSGVFFVDEKIARHLFRVGESYHCAVKRFHTDNELIELSRKQYLATRLDQLKYGQTFQARTVFTSRGVFAYGDQVEGKIVSKVDINKKRSSTIEVMVGRKGRSPRDVELSIA